MAFTALHLLMHTRMEWCRAGVQKRGRILDKRKHNTITRTKTGEINVRACDGRKVQDREQIRSKSERRSTAGGREKER